jgi:hypothetical protein
MQNAVILNELHAFEILLWREKYLDRWKYTAVEKATLSSHLKVA